MLLGSLWSSCSGIMATMRRRQLRADEFAASALVHQVPWHTTLRLVHWIGSNEATFRCL